jgi:hypothetical protein
MEAVRRASRATPRSDRLRQPDRYHGGLDWDPCSVRRLIKSRTATAMDWSSFVPLLFLLDVRRDDVDAHRKHRSRHVRSRRQVMHRKREAAGVFLCEKRTKEIGTY